MAPGNAPQWIHRFRLSVVCWLPSQSDRPWTQTALILLSGSFLQFRTRPQKVPCVLLDGNNGRQPLGARKCTQRDMEFRMGKSVAGDAILPGTLQTSVAHGSPTRPPADGEIQVRVRDLLSGGPDRSGHGAIPGQRDGLTCRSDSEESLNGWAPHGPVLPDLTRSRSLTMVGHDGRGAGE